MKSGFLLGWPRLTLINFPCYKYSHCARQPPEFNLQRSSKWNALHSRCDSAVCYMCCAPCLELRSPEKRHSAGMGMLGQGHKIKQAHLVEWPHVKVLQVRARGWWEFEKVMEASASFRLLVLANCLSRSAPNAGVVDPFKNKETAKGKEWPRRGQPLL